MTRLLNDDDNVDLRAGAKKNGLVIVVLVVAALGGLGYALVSKAPSGETKAVDAGLDAGFDYGRHKTKIKILRLELKRSPCERSKARELVRTLNQAGDYRGTIEFANDYLDRCEFYSRLLWNVSAAHDELGEYQQSAEVITTLIEGRPHDSDFWWWRGERYQSLDEIDLADADYRQSMANKPNKFAARRYLPLMGERTPCEVSSALQTMIEQRPSQVAQWMRDTLSDRYVSGNCDRMKGAGKFEMEVPDSAPAMIAEATINGQTGRFLIQQKSAFTILGRELAERVDPSRTTIDVPVYAGGKFMDGKRAILDTVSLGGASAPKVVGVIVDAVPGGVDGIIGASFLWRFKVEFLESKLTVEGR